MVDLSGQTINQLGNDTIASLTVTGQNVTLNLDGSLDLSGSGSRGTFQVDQPGDSVVVGDSILRTPGYWRHPDQRCFLPLLPRHAERLRDKRDGGSGEPTAAVNLTGRWTNNGTIIANAVSTLALGSQICLAPTDPSAPDYYWTNNGTLSLNPTATVEVGGVLTTDAFESLLPDLNPYILFTGTLDNSPATIRSAAAPSTWTLCHTG